MRRRLLLELGVLAALLASLLTIPLPLPHVATATAWVVLTAVHVARRRRIYAALLRSAGLSAPPTPGRLSAPPTPGRLSAPPTPGRLSAPPTPAAGGSHHGIDRVRRSGDAFWFRAVGRRGSGDSVARGQLDAARRGARGSPAMALTRSGGERHDRVSIGNRTDSL